MKMENQDEFTHARNTWAEVGFFVRKRRRKLEARVRARSSVDGGISSTVSEGRYHSQSPPCLDKINATSTSCIPSSIPQTVQRPHVRAQLGGWLVGWPRPFSLSNFLFMSSFITGSSLLLHTMECVLSSPTMDTSSYFSPPFVPLLLLLVLTRTSSFEGLLVSLLFLWTMIFFFYSSNADSKICT